MQLYAKNFFLNRRSLAFYAFVGVFTNKVSIVLLPTDFESLLVKTPTTAKSQWQMQACAKNFFLNRRSLAFTMDYGQSTMDFYPPADILSPQQPVWHKTWFVYAANLLYFLFNLF